MIGYDIIQMMLEQDHDAVLDGAYAKRLIENVRPSR